jgi:hypothetical protein
MVAGTPNSYALPTSSLTAASHSIPTYYFQEIQFQICHAMMGIDGSDETRHLRDHQLAIEKPKNKQVIVSICQYPTFDSYLITWKIIN